MRLIRRVVSKTWLKTIGKLDGPSFVNLWSPHAGREWREGKAGHIVLLVTDPESSLIHAFGMIYSRAPDLASRAWSRFGPRNGVESLHAMRTQIAEYQPLSWRQDPMIANLVLVNLVMFPKALPFDSSGRELSSIINRELREDEAADYILSLRLSAARLAGLMDRTQLSVHENLAANFSQAEHTALAEMEAWSAYGRRCAVTGWRVECTLAVACFRPLDQGGSPSVENMFLLRKDLFALHVQDLIAFNDEGKLLVSSLLAELYARVYGELGKLRLRRTVFSRLRPDPEHVRWRLVRFHRKQADPAPNDGG